MSASPNPSQLSVARIVTIATMAVGIATGLFYLYSAQFGLFPTYMQRGVLLAATIFIAYLRFAKDIDKTISRLVFVAVALIGSAIPIYIAFVHEEMALRPSGPSVFETILGIVLIVVVLDWTRREIGWGLPVLSVVFVAHAYLGPYLPEFIGHPGLDAVYLAQYIGLEEEGIWGISLGVCATVIVIFMIFGAVLKATGVGEFIVDLSYAAFGMFRGGPAKMAVIGSAMFGTVSGSTVANVVGTGTFTIPLMKRVGYRPDFAGAVEATASAGGQIMPPVMGASAFIMAQVLGVPYSEVMVAALLPALLYFMAIFFAVDLEAARTGLAGLPRAQLPNFGRLILTRGYLLAPIGVLIVCLVTFDWSPMKAAFWGTVVALITGFVNPKTRRQPLEFVRAIGLGIIEMAPITAACACSGIFIGALTMTGLTLKLSTVLIAWSGGSLLVLLVLTMFASLVLGMGLPTVACYIMLAILVAPALISMGADTMASHLFVFYFGIVSAITPPVAMAAFAGAAIAGGNQIRTGFVAMRLGLSGFILPFMFVLAPALLFKGSATEVLIAAVGASIGIWALSASVIGYVFGPLNYLARAALLAAALALIFPGIRSGAAGLVVIALVLIPHWWFWSRKKAAQQSDAVTSLQESTGR